jgi:hypothetical protein
MKLPLQKEKVIKKGPVFIDWPFVRYGAGGGTRTRDLNLGKVALYQLSYTRALIEQAQI